MAESHGQMGIDGTRNETFRLPLKHCFKVQDFNLYRHDTGNKYAAFNRTVYRSYF